MWVSEHKRKTNIAEFIIYMWQIEDLIRSYNLDLIKIEEEIISKHDLNEEQEDQLFNWYKTLITEMRAENIVNSGHLQRTNIILNELEYLHKNLFEVQKDFEYSSAFEKCSEDLKSLKAKMGVNPGTDIEVCLSGLYASLLMKLKKTSINEETSNSLKRISSFITVLAKKYHKAFEAKS